MSAFAEQRCFKKECETALTYSVHLGTPLPFWLLVATRALEQTVISTITVERATVKSDLAISLCDGTPFPGLDRLGPLGVVRPRLVGLFGVSQTPTKFTLVVRSGFDLGLPL